MELYGIKYDQIESKRTAHCMFEWVYFARRDSIIDKIPVSSVRNRLGIYLAKKDHVKADVVSPIPYSGIGHAEGYHEGSKIPYKEVLVRKRFVRRTFILETDEERTNEVNLKFSPIEENIKGKTVVLVDDSIVRGTTMKNRIINH